MDDGATGPDIQALRRLADELRVAHAPDATRATLITLLTPDARDTSLHARMLRDQLGLISTSPSKRSPLVHRLPAAAPPVLLYKSSHAAHARGGPDTAHQGQSAFVRRMNVAYQLA